MVFSNSIESELSSEPEFERKARIFWIKTGRAWRPCTDAEQSTALLLSITPHTPKQDDQVQSDGFSK